MLYIVAIVDCPVDGHILLLLFTTPIYDQLLLKIHRDLGNIAQINTTEDISVEDELRPPSVMVNPEQRCANHC